MDPIIFWVAYQAKPFAATETSRRLLVGGHLQQTTDTKTTCFNTQKLVPTHKTTEYFFCYYFNPRRWPGQPPETIAMKRGTINFGGSIFRRTNDQQPAASNSQPHQQLLPQRLADRKITLKHDDLKPLTKETPPLDWAIVNGQITVPATAVDGLLDGRARIRAEHLKSLIPPPIGSEVPDATEYGASLAVIIQQIQDVLQPGEAAPERQPEFETPFTALAKEDGLRFPSGNHKRQTAKPPTKEDDDGASLQAETQTSHFPLKPHTETQHIEDSPTPDLPAKQLPLSQDNQTPSEETSRAHAEQLPETLVSASSTQSAFDSPPEDIRGGAFAARAPYEPSEEAARRGVEQLQEIFMVDEALDGRKVASLVRQFPGVTGALILLEGGAILGGQLPDWLNLEAALQAPEVLAHFIRFIVELEPAQTVQSQLVTVTSATTITLVHSGKIVLLVSHHSRKLPPGLPQRLTETAQALNLIYGDPCS